MPRCRISSGADTSASSTLAVYAPARSTLPRTAAAPAYGVSRSSGSGAGGGTAGALGRGGGGGWGVGWGWEVEFFLILGRGRGATPLPQSTAMRFSALLPTRNRL